MAGTRRQFLRTLGTGLIGAVIGGGVTGTAMRRWYASQNAAPPLPLGSFDLQPLTIITPSGMKIHHIQTGFVAVKTVHREYTGQDGAGFPAIMADTEWTEWMPISAWANGGTAGIASDPAAMRDSLANIRAYLREHPTMYLPSHDGDLRNRLANQQITSI